MESDSVTDILSKLSLASDDERQSLLSSIKPFFLKRDSEEILKPILNQSDLGILFDILTTSKDDTLESVCNIVNMVFEIVDKKILLARYSFRLTQCLENSHVEVKICVLKLLTLIANSKDEQIKAELVQNSSILSNATRCLLDDSAGVSETAGQFIFALAAITKGPEGSAAFSSPVLPILAEACESTKAVIRMRIFSLIVRIASTSQELTERASKEGFLQRLCVEVQDVSDILGQLNAIEILADLAETRHGFNFLVSHGVLEQMDRLLNKMSSDPMADLVMPGFVKFFGRVCHQCPDDFSTKYPGFFSILNSSLADQDRTKQILAVETVGHISLGPNGKRAIKPISEETVKTIAKILKQGTDHEQVRILSGFGNLMKFVSDNTSSECEELFEKYGAMQLMNKMTDLLRLPFGDLSSSGFTFLLHVSDHSWSSRKFTSHPGFIELLLNRDLSLGKEPKEYKYQLVRAIVKNQTTKNLVPDNLWLRLKKYVEEGPFYVEAQPQVAFEGDE